MPEPKGEYQIPQTEFVVDQPEIVEASSTDTAAQSIAQYYNSLDRHSEYYANRPAILAEEAEKLVDRQALVALGNDIHELRQALLEKRLATPKLSAMKQVLNLIMIGPFDSYVDKERRADEAFRALMNEESSIGSSLIEVPSTVGRQEFFLSPSDPHEWYYHAQSLLHPDVSITIRYMVLASGSGTSGVVKSINGGSYKTVTGDELERFTILTKNYSNQVSTKDSYELAA